MTEERDGNGNPLEQVTGVIKDINYNHSNFDGDAKSYKKLDSTKKNFVDRTGTTSEKGHKKTKGILKDILFNSSKLDQTYEFYNNGGRVSEEGHTEIMKKRREAGVPEEVKNAFDRRT